jgi:serine/threonine-protein kinase
MMPDRPSIAPLHAKKDPTMPESSAIDPAELATALGGRFELHPGTRRGGQGTVFRATRRRDRDGVPAAEDVALKLYENASQVERIDREVAAMQRVRHASLANLVEAGEVVLGRRRYRFVACDFIEGEALDERIRRGPLSPRTVAIVGRDIATAIAEIWAERIVHRDVNPKNIMLRVGEREAVLIDLGIARHIGQSPLTTVGSTWGTQGYMAPEHARAEQGLTCKADVFSLGVVLQEALAGRHPTGGSQQALEAAIPETAVVASGAPAGLARMIDRMLSPRAAFRAGPDEVRTAMNVVIGQLSH